MSCKKSISVLILPLFLALSVTAQSLVEAAKKEKERRESLKGKKIIVVTNVDLVRVKKRPAVDTGILETSAEDQNKNATETNTAERPPQQTPDSGLNARSAQDLQNEAQKNYNEIKAELQAKWEKAKELGELLNLKMSALRQQFYSFNSMTPKDQIQKAISETFQKLQAAQAEEAKAKEELEKFLSRRSNENLPPIWIK